MDHTTASVSRLLLDWYDRHHRELPWRVSPSDRRAGIRPDPYHVWLSEIMLQQTTVQAVKPYFANFLDQWPEINALALQRPRRMCSKPGAGLGYYSRARNLKKCADAVVQDHAGRFPSDEQSLRALPGIGDYTAAAIAAIAFDRHAAVVDGNVERVVSRLKQIDTPLPPPNRKSGKSWHKLRRRTVPGDFAQAMMDLGATLCTPETACVFALPAQRKLSGPGRGRS